MLRYYDYKVIVEMFRMSEFVCVCVREREREREREAEDARR